jgi:chemotaxis protein MotA
MKYSLDELEEASSLPLALLLLSAVAAVGMSLSSFDVVLKLFDVRSFVLVLGGSIAATSIHYSPSVVTRAFSQLSSLLRSQGCMIDSYSPFLISLSQGVRHQGMLFLESKSILPPDDESKYALELALDGRSEDEYRSLLRHYFLKTQRPLVQAIEVMSTLGACTPAMGLIGTLLGLIQLLGADPASFGAGLSLAVVTTLHGALLSHLLFLPISGRLLQKKLRIDASHTLLLEGMCALRKEETPLEMKERLASFG